MKKLLFFLFVGLISAQLSLAQMHVSTDLREDYDWNASKNEWVFYTDDKTSATLFDFNKDMSMFKHTTASISSSYYIKSNSYDKEKKIWQYEVLSDVGNKYTLILNPDQSYLSFIGTRKDGSLFLVKHRIKRLWYDE